MFAKCLTQPAIYVVFFLTSCVSDSSNLLHKFDESQCILEVNSYSKEYSAKGITDPVLRQIRYQRCKRK